MKWLFMISLIFSLITTEALAQSGIVTERITDEVDMLISSSDFGKETVFHFNNINGDLNVEGYSGDDIIITGNKIITGKPNIRRSFDPDDFYLDMISNGGQLFVFVRHPGLDIEIEEGELSYRSNRQNDWEERVQGFEFNLEIKVPRYLASKISTINAGEVVIQGLNSDVEAANINGSVILRNVAGGKILAETVNGNIKAEFDENPVADVELHTVNGNIEISALKSFSAAVTFKSLHGDLYTDFDDRSFRKDRSVKMDGMTRFNPGNSETIQFGQGGPNVLLRLLNGNAFIKQL